MVGVVGNLERDHPVEEGGDGLAPPGHRLVPELEVSTPLLVPPGIEVDEHVDAAMRLQLVVAIEVRVDLEEVAPSNQMGAPADEVWVGLR